MEDNEGRTPLHFSIDNNNIALFKELLCHKDLDVNATDKYGHTPFHDAIECCRPLFVEALLTHKNINIHVKDNLGRTPLEITELLTDAIQN